MPTILIRIELLELELEFKYLEKTFSLKNIRDEDLIKFQTKGVQIY